MTRGGKRTPQPGRPPKPPGEKYLSMSLKLPPDVAAWLKQTTGNRNGFIVDLLREKMKTE